MRATPIFALLATALACALFAASAQAVQRDRVFVASYGSDSNPCTFGSPCKTFQSALSAVAAGGEITAIDSAGFGPVTINKAVTITSPAGVEAGIAAAAGDNAVTVDAGTGDVVVLSGLTLEGAQSGLYGIAVTQAGEVEIVNCAIRNYMSSGVNVGNMSAMSLLISNTVITGNGSGVNVVSSGGNLIIAMNGVTIEGNSAGISNQATSGAIEESIANSHIDNNTNNGIYAQGTNGSNDVNIILSQVTLNQSPDGIRLNGFTNAWLSHVTQSASPIISSTTGVLIQSSNNVVSSDGTNLLAGGVSGGSLATWTSN
jgi:hypothetical protein